MAIVESRYTDPTPVRCEDCSWQGRIMDCVHSYAPIGITGEVEPMDYCPECFSKNLIPIEEDLVPV